MVKLNAIEIITICNLVPSVVVEPLVWSDSPLVEALLTFAFCNFSLQEFVAQYSFWYPQVGFL